jgi:hypothetical protein
MTIKISVEIETPLAEADFGLLTDISIALLATADRRLAGKGYPDALTQAEEATRQASPCGVANPANESEACVGGVGHPGRHQFRATRPN